MTRPTRADSGSGGGGDSVAHSFSDYRGLGASIPAPEAGIAIVT
jgi:hypothetical protein